VGKLLLTGGAYQARSVIASAQRCLNLFTEANPEETSPPVPVTHYPRPGKKVFALPPALGQGRGLYRATNGDLYTVVDHTLYFVNSVGVYSAIGDLVDTTFPIVSMADNGEDVGNVMGVVDGTTNGWTVALDTRVFAAISDPTGTFVGSTTINYLSGFFLFNAPATPYWYSSLLNSMTFNALDLASKNAYADNIQIVGVRQRETWLIGQLSTEPWYLSGASPFAFEAVSTTFVSYGCAAPYSQVSLDSELFWISQDLKGQAIVVQSSGYKAQRISTHAIEQILQGYVATFGSIVDAIGSTYQIQGHTFYVLSFPTADATWQYDIATKQWSQLCWLDNDGNEHRDRCVLYVNAYNQVLGLDWQTGIIYIIDVNTYTDNGLPIKCLRSFPHVVDEMKRITHWALVADMECGTTTDPGPQDAEVEIILTPAPGWTVISSSGPTIIPSTPEPPLLNLRYSDDRGVSFSDYITTSMGNIGEYLTSPQFTRLGMARDRVYELSWSEPIKTALNGAYILTEEAQS
jgi:hypothetical protein